MLLRLRGGELVQGSININNVLINTHYNIDEDRTAMLDIDHFINKGFQGKVVGIKGDLSKVAKMMKLKNGVLDKETKENVYLHVYGSNIDVGPKIYGTPFITTDSSHIVFIMDKVVPYKPISSDNAEIIDLFTRAFQYGLVPFDFEHAKDIHGRILFLDFGVCGLYPSYKDAIQNAIENDVFLFYDKDVANHFQRELENRNKNTNERKGGYAKKKGKKQNKKTITLSIKKNINRETRKSMRNKSKRKSKNTHTI